MKVFVATVAACLKFAITTKLMITYSTYNEMTRPEN